LNNGNDESFSKKVKNGTMIKENEKEKEKEKEKKEDN